MVNTNISLNEMLRTIQYLDKVKPFSFGLNSSYGYDNLSAQKGSFLYNPQRELFNGAAVLLPLGANAANIGVYDKIHDYVDFITHLQGFLLENPTIAVKNGMSKELLRSKGLQNTKIAGKIGAKMKRYGLPITALGNAEPQAKTQLIIKTENPEAQGFEATIAAIKNFVPIDEVVYQTGIVKSLIDDYGNEVMIFTGTDLELILGDSYLSGGRNQFKHDELKILHRESF